MTVDIDTTAAVKLNFDKVQSLRDLRDTALSLSAYCKAGSEIIEALQEIAGTGFQGAWSLKPFDTRLRGHDETLSVLTKRAGNATELVSAENWNVWIFTLIENAFDEVCVCARFEESVYCCRYQQPCLSTYREDRQGHNSCDVDHASDTILSAR